MAEPFSDLLDRPVPPWVQINLEDFCSRQGPDYFDKPSWSGRNYWTMCFRHCPEDSENPGITKYGFTVERWQAADGDRWRTREILLSAPGKPYLSRDLAPIPTWHRWHHTQRMSGRFAVYQLPRLLRPLIWPFWWLSDQLWTFGEDHSGWKWESIEAVQERHEQLWSARIHGGQTNG